jgi:mRNA interferase MazF
LTLLRGEIWWVSLHPTVGSEITKTRPCVVVTDNILNERRRTVVVIPLSSSPRANPPLLIPVTCQGRQVVAAIDQIRAVAKERFHQRIGVVSGDELSRLEEAVKDILDLS